VSAGEPAVVLTGATGFVGLQVLDRVLEAGRRAVCLVRAEDDAAAQRRVEDALGTIGPEAHARAGQVEALAADLEAPGLGLPQAAREALAERTEVVVHSGASIAFDVTLPEARRVNVEGTERVLALARAAHERGTLKRMVSVSTAYVAGEHTGTFGEDDLDLGVGFRNPYERSKAEAETMLRERGADLPLSVVRPSIVVGEARSGWTTAFNVIYWPLRAYARGLLRLVPARVESRVDVVPVDVVAEAIWRVASEEPAHPPEGVETLAVVAGERAPRMDELTQLASTLLGRPYPELVPPEQFAERVSRGDVPQEVLESPALAQARHYVPYFGVRARFDDRLARARLGPATRAPALGDYFGLVLAYAQRSRWGREPQTRTEARAQARQEVAA
jgi:long-chain acyl-CoA synthetase